jgi:hypothetical protein
MQIVKNTTILFDPYKIFVVDLSQYKMKNDITRCFTTCYVVISCGGKMGDSLYSRVSDRNLNNIDHFWGSIFLFMVLFTSYLQNVV